MNYFVVFQNKTYDKESKEGILWAPKKNKNGGEVFHWSNMTKVQPGDIVFSILRNRIVSINRATSLHYEAVIPAEFSSYGWELDGWKVDLEYNSLENPIKMTDIIDQLYPLLSAYRSPFQSSGRGNQGYLYEIPKLAGEYLIEELSSYNVLKGNLKFELEELIVEFKELENINITGADKEAILKIRVGHGKFKRELLKIQDCCQLCGLNLSELLIASHIKPWSKSDEYEKVDANNGLLLCPNHDSLFDIGLISFTDDGDLLVSSVISSNTNEKLGLNKTLKIKMNSKRINYISWHRDNIYKK